jgi:hypothetical protein
MTIIIILSVIAIPIIILIIGKINLSIQFKKEVTELFSLSKNISNKTFNYGQISGLPEPVQHYFKHVLKEGQPYISYVRLTHDGQFKPDLKKDWVDIEGEQYFTTEKPGFIWKGKSSLFTVRDMYMSDKGRIIVSLFSFFKVVNGEGAKYDQGELLRWLGESILFPTNLLPNEYLKWTSIDSVSAGLTFNYNDLSLFYKVSFNNKCEITQLETKRYMGEDSLETWIGKLSDYKEINGIIIPTKIEGIWSLRSGDFSYAKFNIKNIEYGKPEKY